MKIEKEKKIREKREKEKRRGGLLEGGAINSGCEQVITWGPLTDEQVTLSG